MTLKEKNNTITMKVREKFPITDFERRVLVTLSFRLPDNLTEQERDEITSSLCDFHNIPSYISYEVFRNIEFCIEQSRKLVNSNRDLSLVTKMKTGENYIYLFMSFRSPRNFRTYYGLIRHILTE